MDYQVKIDVDCSDETLFKSFYEWLKWFSYSYPMIMTRSILFNDCSVFRTKHGFHVYLHVKGASAKGKSSGSNLDLVGHLECLLGSDLRKQLYCFVEGNDILFSQKEGRKEIYDRAKTLKLFNLIRSCVGYVIQKRTVDF